MPYQLSYRTDIWRGVPVDAIINSLDATRRAMGNIVGSMESDRFKRIIHTYKADPESVYNTWFINVLSA